MKTVKEIDYTNSPIYTRAVDDTRHKIMKGLQDVISIQAQKGNWDYDPYMMGLLNGLIMAKSICTGKEPEFYSAPKRWGKDYPLFWTRVKWWLFGAPKPVSGEVKNELLK